jgi:hypothetical protein
MVGAQYKISENALRHVIDASKEYVRWMGFVPVSPEIKQKIEDARKIVYDAERQANELENRMQKILDGANRKYVKRAADLLKQSTGVPAKTFEEVIRWPTAHLRTMPTWDNYEFEKELQNANEIKLEPRYYAQKHTPDLVHCPRLEARQFPSCKGKWYNVKMIDASQNDQGFAVTLYAPAPKFSKNYKMLKQYAALEELVKQAAK